MATLPVYDRTGKQVGSYEIEPTEFAPHVNRQLLHDAVVMYQANLRLGTHKTKCRAEVAGTTKKMYRQKGTGNARAGSRRSGVRRGGGHIFAIRPRDYYYRMPRKAVQAATRMALAARIRDGEVLLLDDLSMAAPKTSEVAATLKAVIQSAIPDKREAKRATLLLGTAGHDPVVYKSVRNIPGVEVSPVSDFNALSLLRPRRVVMTKAGMDLLRKQAAERKKPAAAKA